MASIDLSTVAKQMRKIDFCMMTTKCSDGSMQSRPMSNNGDVEFDGDSYFFTYTDTAKVEQLNEHSDVSLSFSGKSMNFIEVSGKASLHEDKATMQKHWYDSLKYWFPEGIDTPGIALIHVKADTIRYWSKEDQETINL